MEMQSFDPFYLFASSALKPEPIDVRVKVVMIGDCLPIRDPLLRG